MSNADEDIERALRNAQTEYLAARPKRQAAVNLALDNGWSIRRIARTIGVRPTVIDAIRNATSKTPEGDQ